MSPWGGSRSGSGPDTEVEGGQEEGAERSAGAAPGRREAAPSGALQFLRELWEHPDTDTALVLAGPGSERALRRVPTFGLAGDLGVGAVPSSRRGRSVDGGPSPAGGGRDRGRCRVGGRARGAWQFTALGEAHLASDRRDMRPRPWRGGLPDSGAVLHTTHGTAVTGASGPGECASRSCVYGDGSSERGGLPSSSPTALRGPAVRRLLALRQQQERAQSRDRFIVTPDQGRLLASWKGNVAAAHGELTAREARRSHPLLRRHSCPPCNGRSSGI